MAMKLDLGVLLVNVVQYKIDKRKDVKQTINKLNIVYNLVVRNLA